MAWSLFALAISLIGVSAVLLILAWTAPVPDQWGFRGYWAMGALIAVPGLLVALHQPTNPIGWLLLVAALAGAWGGAVQEYVTYGVYVRAGEMPLLVPLAWLGSWTFAFFAVPLLMLIPQLFPTGRPLSPRWRPLVWITAGYVAAFLVMFGLRPGPLENASFIDNPIVLTPALAEVRAAAAGAVSAGLVVLVLASWSSVALRFRRSSGIERQQLKWVALSGGLISAAITLVVVTTPVATDTNTFKPAQVLMIIAFNTLPVAFGIAMLRYRLYDVDLIINRAIVYGALSAVLAATYVVFVLLLQGILRPLTGGSEIAVAASTLAVVTLVQPLRRRIQDAVDRRFYRARYDAARTLDTLASRLRDEVDLDAVRREIAGVVSETVHPRHASVWLREPSR